MVRPTGFREAGAAAEPSALVQRTETAELCERIFRSARGGGALLVLEGRAGTGKSAMLQAACSAAQAGGLQVLRAAGSELEGDFPYGVVRQLLEPQLPRPAEAVLGAAQEPAESQHALHHALLRLLVDLSAAGPVVLAVDDVGLADEPSLEFLQYLAQRQAQHPIVTIATLTTGGSAAPPWPLGLLRVHQAAVVARLEPFDANGVAALLERSGAPAPALACSEVMALTGGNPFLVASLVEGFRGDPTILDRLREPGGEAHVPPEVTRDLALRLARLPAEASVLARTAAVLGEGASVALAARVMEVRPALALDAVEALAAADVLCQSGVIAFTAPLVRTALYGMLAHGERSRVHRLAAQALWLGGSSAADAADHLMRSDAAGDGWATDVLRAAAHETREPGRAVGYLRRALAEGPSAHARAELLGELAAAELSGGGSEAARHLAEAVELLPPGSHRAEAREQLGRVLWGLGRYEEAGRAFEGGVEELGDEGGAVGPRLRAACVAAQRLRLGASRDGPELDRLPRESYLGEPAMEAQLALELLLAGGPCARVVELAETALAGDRLLSQQTCCGPAFQGALCALVWGDELDVAERATALAIEDARRRAIEPALGLMLLLRGCALLRAGRLAEALEAAAAARDRAPTLLPVPVPCADALLAEIRLELGQLEGAREAATAAVDATAPAAARTAAGMIQHALALNARGAVELAAGDAKVALSDLLECGRLLGDAEVRNPAPAPWRSRAAIALNRLGEHERAAALVEEELALANAFGAPRPVGRALAARACLRARADRTRDLRAAAAALARTPARLELAHALAELGADLRRSGHRRAAREALRSSLDLAVGSGADALARRARQDLVATGARPRRARISGAASLTPRERQVAELAAQGQSNQAIADRLIVSQKTIEWHLANAYRKLEIRGRAGLRESLAET